MTSKAARFITQLMAEIAKWDARIAELEADIVYLKSAEKERNALRDEISALKAKPSAGVADEREAQAGEGTSSNKYRAELYDEVWQAARDMGYGNVTGALQDLAALKARQPSAGVVLPDLIAELKKQAEEIARKGHAGWGNTMLSAAEALSVAGVVLPERKGMQLHHDVLIPTYSKAWNACLDEVARLNPGRALAPHACMGRSEHSGGEAMSGAKRYEFEVDDRYLCDCGNGSRVIPVAIDAGKYVLASDYDACASRLHEVAEVCAIAEQERDALRAQVEVMRELLFQVRQYVRIEDDDALLNRVDAALQAKP